MVIAETAQAVDLYVQGSGAFGRCALNPPAIQLVLTEAELMGMYKGSGGTLQPLFSAKVSGSSTILSDFSEELPTGISQVLESLQSAFLLTQDEVAQVCKVKSRMTPHNWVSGRSTPRASTLNRLLDLDMVAQAWLQKGFTTDKHALHQPLVKGESLFDLLRHDNIDGDLILFAGSRMQMLTAAEDLEDPFA